MVRRFPIADLRTLAARALELGSYTPADSGRIRAVPDTRTIRYYTTLGLVDRPAEMRGRTALYEKRHVLQLVAIKRLQAEDQTLSDIQAKLVGITPKQLARIADLPDGFWESADQYLRDPPSRESSGAGTSSRQADAPASNEPAFWSTPAALPGSPPIPAHDDLSSIDVCLRVALHRQVQLLISRSTKSTGSIDQDRLTAAAQPLMDELIRQGLLSAIVGDDRVPQSSSGSDSSHSPEASS